MKKIFLIFILFCFVLNPCFAWKKKEKTALILSSSYENLINNQTEFIFKPNQRIYFLINNPKGFKSDYIKYQIIKQDDNAHIGGYSRINNVTCRLKNKYGYSDYFLLTQKGKYFIQIFDITNLQQWVAIQGFQVIEE